MGLDGAVGVDDHRRHARLAGDHEAVEERAEVHAGAGQAEHPRAVAHLDVEPDLGQAELLVVVDVDVVVGLPGDAGEEPGVLRVGRVERVARLLAGRLAGVVEVVVVAGGGDDEPGVVAEIALVAGRLGEELRTAPGVVLLQQPAAGQLAVGEAPRQRQFARQRGEQPLAVQQGEVARVGLAEMQANLLHRPPAEQQRRNQRQHARQQQSQYRLAAQPPVRRHPEPPPPEPPAARANGHCAMTHRSREVRLPLCETDHTILANKSITK